MKPTFIVIGAARSGTTSLFQYFDAHPDIFMSQVKELNFFSNEKYWNKGFKWYEANFPGDQNQYKAVGEISPSYTKAPFTEDVVSRIHDYASDVKLIYVVRNPMERCISHYLHRVQRGYETRHFSDILGNLPNEAFAAQGLYHYQLQQYLKAFPKEQLLVISFDNLKKHTQETVSQIYDFIGVESRFEHEETDKVFNANNEIILKGTLGLKILNFYHQHIEQRNVPYPLKKAIMNASNWGGTPIGKPKLDEQQKAVLDGFYREDSAKLSQDYGIETQHWYK